MTREDIAELISSRLAPYVSVDTENGVSELQRAEYYRACLELADEILKRATCE